MLRIRNMKCSYGLQVWTCCSPHVMWNFMHKICYFDWILSLDLLHFACKVRYYELLKKNELKKGVASTFIKTFEKWRHHDKRPRSKLMPPWYDSSKERMRAKRRGHGTEWRHSLDQSQLTRSLLLQSVLQARSYLESICMMFALVVSNLYAWSLYGCLRTSNFSCSDFEQLEFVFVLDKKNQTAKRPRWAVISKLLNYDIPFWQPLLMVDIQLNELSCVISGKIHQSHYCANVTFDKIGQKNCHQCNWLTVTCK